MGDYLLKGDNNKKRNILIIIILILCMRLFFSALFEENARAERNVPDIKLNLENIDPAQKIGQSLFQKNENSQTACAENPSEYVFGETKNPNEAEYEQLVKGHPIEAMIPEIAKKDRITAAFLIGIAKKESDWGKHSPVKNGRDCYNYWGYKGGYNLTDSGYSCFDNPEQAVLIVGGRIEELINKKINTPERMVVWKCGSSCAGHDPAGVAKWISDVKHYFYLSA